MQAARGASLSDARESSLLLRSLFIGIAVIALAVDQVTKALAASRLTPGEPRHLVGSLLQLDLIRNSGAAFSTGTGHTEWFSALAIVATIVVLWFGFQVGSRVWSAALGFLLAGVVGNLIDRIAREPAAFRGHVVDFLELPHWPVFNVADVCITIAAVLIILQALRGVRPSGARETRDAS